jgi:chitin disaccharide deacetylase
METDRREFFQIMGAGVAGLELAAAVPSTAAQASKVSKTGGARMKMIFRADDVGYTKVCNIGAFETMERGVVTSADVMLDTPGTEDALERLKALPWISVGWHTHFWGSPVLKPEKVSSLIIKEEGRIRFRKDLHTANDVVFEQALMELRAQIDRCVSVLGKAPDTGGAASNNSPFVKALTQVCEEYGIASNFTKSQSASGGSRTSERWAGRNIYNMSGSGSNYKTLSSTDSMAELDKVDNIKELLESRLDYKENDYVVSIYHPGYLDYFVYRLGDYGSTAKNFLLIRLQDVESLCSDRLKNWIKENRIELSNFRDALYGTREYQNHLKAIGSDLCMI